ncbi:MAG: MFS transporter [Candidatus Nanohaloarchaeota archaeon QJJ-5]|nr:MFS transporter [Candidatus Nanohaloarchaeota archaeon QJJ-5]
MRPALLSPLYAIRSYREDLAEFDTHTRVLLISVLVNSIGTGLILPFIVIYFEESVGIAYTLIGIALGIRGAFDLTFKLVGGYTTDRIGRKPTLVAGILCMITSYFLYIMASDFIGLVIGVIVQGIGIGLFWPSTLSMVDDLVSEEMKDRGYAIERVARVAGQGLGIALGGFIAVYSYTLLFQLNIAFTTLFLLLVLWKLPETKPDTIEDDESGLRHIIDSIKDPRLTWFAIINIMFAFMLSQLFNIIPPYLNDHLDVSNFLIGNIFLINAALITWFQMQVTDRVEQTRQLRAFKAGFLLWIGASLLLFVAVPGLIALICSVLALVLISFATMVYQPPSITFVSQLAPDGKIGAYTSLYSVSYSLGFMIGPAVGGWFLDTAYPSSLWLIIAIMAIITLAGLQLYDKWLITET